MPGEGGATELQQESEGSSVRLDSWKEIAAYLRRDPRTVRRWERQEGLPVRRHLHGKRGSIYAFTHEIDKWFQTRSVVGTGQPLSPELAQGSGK